MHKEKAMRSAFRLTKKWRCLLGCLEKTIVAILLGVALVGCSATAPVSESSTERVTPKVDSNAFFQGKAAYLSGEYAQARTIFLPLASEGDAQAQYALGYMLFYGEGGDPDIELAERLFRAAAEQGHPDAMQALVLIRRGRAQMEKR